MTGDRGDLGDSLLCVDLRTGESRRVGRMWRKEGNTHCIACGFGYVAVVTGSTIFIAEEANWNHYWSRESVGNMLNSCVLTKLLEGENGEPEEVVLIVGSNGGAIYTLAIPKPLPDEYMLVDGPAMFPTSSIDQTDVPEGKVRVLRHVEKPHIKIKQYLTKKIVQTESSSIPNINCVVQGKGMYTDYIIAAPDYEPCLLVFVRQYDDQQVVEQPTLDDSGEAIEDGKEVIFALIEQQRDRSSILLPLCPPDDSFSNPIPEGRRNHRITWNDRARVCSLNLAWAPWHHRSIIAAGTDSCDLIIYDFDAAQALLSENQPDHVFTLEESAKTVLFAHHLRNEVRLLKFSPLSSVPILAFATMDSKVYFVDCTDWSLEWVTVPNIPTGFQWALDASALLVATRTGCVKITIKKLPSLTDQLIYQIANSGQTHQFEEFDESGDIKERLNLLSFGLVRDGSKVSWLDEDIVNPPIRLKSGPGPDNPMFSNRIIRPFLINSLAEPNNIPDIDALSLSPSESSDEDSQ